MAIPIGPGPVFVYESPILARRRSVSAGRSLLVLAVPAGLGLSWWPCRRAVRGGPGDVIGWASFIVLGIGVGAGLYFGLPWWGGLVGGATLASILAGWMSSLTKYEPPVYRTVAETVEVGRSKCCIACREAVQRL